MEEERAIPPDLAVSALAARQHGVVSGRQLTACGLGRTAITKRVQAGRLHRIHRGVYAVGHRGLTRHGRWMAAVLAAGEGAALSHTSAAALWQLLPLDNDRLVHVTVPGGRGRRRGDGIVLHRSITLTRDDAILRFGIPVTRPARTIADRVRVVARERVEEAMDRARGLGLEAGDPGLGEAPTRSRLERRFRSLCRRHRLPPPEVNVRVGAFRVDFLWRDQRLIFETDGFETHGTRASFEADRARDAHLKLMGYEVVRFTYRQIVEQPDRVAATLRALLSASWRVSPRMEE